MRKLAPLAVVLFLFSFAPFHDVRADPAVITSGSFVVQGPGTGPFTFSMSGPDISFEGSGLSILSNIGPFASCRLQPCSAVTLSSIASSGDLFVRNVMHNGIFIPQLTMSTGSLYLQFNAPSVQIPSAFLSTAGVVVTWPFTFTGHLGIVQSSRLVTHPLSGIGFVEVQLTSSTTFPIPGFLFQNARYNFVATQAEIPPASIQAIPEPTTVLLLSTGLAGLGAAIRKRRRKSR